MLAIVAATPTTPATGLATDLLLFLFPTERIYPWSASYG